MSEELHHIISNLLAESRHFNVNDVLVDARNDHRGLYFVNDSRETGISTLDLTALPKRILSDARLNLKESGVNTLCAAFGILELQLNGRDVQTPILLVPISATVDRIKQTVSFQEFEDDSFVNPFIISHFRKTFELTIPEDLLSKPTLNALIDYFVSKELVAKAESCALGNFHHHRYEVLKELEELLEIDDLNPAIGHLFGMGSASLPRLDVSSTNLFAADTDHETVFESASTSHTVIQGPPGTGKSQVICNLIGKALATKQTILAVSEKRAALEVIESKLAHYNLDTLSFVAGSDRQSRHFLESMKRTWEVFDSFQRNKEVNLQLSDQYEDNLQMTLDLLSQTDLIGGVSFHEFFRLSEGKELDVRYSSMAPTIAQFIQNKEVIEIIFRAGIANSTSFVRKKTIGSDAFLMIDQRIHSLQQRLQALQAIFTLETWSDLSQAMKEAATCQVFENELFKQYSSIFTPKSKEQKRFKRLAKKYASLAGETYVGSEWKTYPSFVEAKSLKQQVTEGSFFEKRAAKKRWKQLSNLPFSEATKILNKRLNVGDRETKLAKCRAQLQKIGVHHPEKEIERIQQSLSVFSDDKWKIFQAIPKEHRTKITAHHKALSDIHHELQTLFKFDANTNLDAFLSAFDAQLPMLISERKNLLLLDESELISLRDCPNFEAYEALVLGSNYTQFKERFPAFSTFQPKEIKQKVNSILAAQHSEGKVHADHLLNEVHRKFSEYHTLLNTPARKLTEDQKLLKKELRRGKSLLIKEFGKTRSHPTLRELYASEARHWISLLKPIWLSNPSSLANCFPMEQNCFDLVIFDEASQIPVQHALGAIQRSKRIVVAGDEHQMGPSNYFQSGLSEITDLLHQASYHFPKVPLLHHYRSAHPELIAFSNKHFYGGQLTAYPSANRNDRPIRHHFVENAVFKDRVNEVEAKSIAALISTQLKEKKSLGIVAFSEEQLAGIWKQLDVATQDTLLNHQETHGGFFKALENVQGDECDSLIIGFGYAPNENGDFHLRFGPMNTENGRKRLNVLLTRARESIDFFCSVRSSDFKLSDNESINLLRQWIAFSERNESKEDVVFPYNLAPKIDGKNLVFDRIQNTLPTAREIVTLQSVLENRGWSVNYS